MIRLIVFLVTWLSASLLSAVAQPQVSVAPYYGGRLAALSLTFDDGLIDHYTKVFPQLKARGLKATFAIIGSKVGGVMRSKQDRQEGTDGTPCMTWDMLREMAADGQEIASHGWEHKAVTRLDGEALRHEVEANDSAIVANIGTKSMTYVYPGNNKSDATIAYCEQGRVGSRTFQLSLGLKRTVEFLKNYLDSLVEKGEWGVTMTHGILRGYDHFQDAQVLWAFLDEVCARHDLLWTASHRDVAAYVKEREHTTLDVSEQNGATVITLRTSLSPSLYIHPLTLELPARRVRLVEQCGSPLTVYTCAGRQLVDVRINGGPVTVFYE